jgi:hypothetical protein
MIKSSKQYDAAYDLLGLLDRLNLRWADPTQDNLLETFDDEYGECNCGYSPDNCMCEYDDEDDEDEGNGFVDRIERLKNTLHCYEKATALLKYVKFVETVSVKDEDESSP